jgi:hypothetical protein
VALLEGIKVLLVDDETEFVITLSKRINKRNVNVSVSLAVVFLIGTIIGATVGGVINRVLYEINPVLSDAFITTENHAVA